MQFVRLQKLVLLLVICCLGHGISPEYVQAAEQGKPETWKIALTAGFDKDERAPSMDIVRQIRGILEEMKFQVRFVNESELTRAQCQKACKEWGADLSIASGFNAYSDKKACGMTLYVHPDKAGSGSESLADKTLTEIANIPIHKHEQHNCGVRKLAFPLCDCEKMGGEASILVKYAFHTNPDEAHKYVNSPDAQREYAIAVAKAICNYTGVKYTGLEAVKPPEPKPEPPAAEPTPPPAQPAENSGLPAGVIAKRGTVKAGEKGLICRAGPGSNDRKGEPIKWGHTARVIGVTADGNWFYLESGAYVNAAPTAGTFTPE